ncbi:MAG: DUF3604 domain-containing protein [Pseudomonadota bacterium]
MRWYHLAAVFVLIAAVVIYFFVQSRLSAPIVGDAQIEQLRAAASAEDETAFSFPAVQAADFPAANPLKNVYFGDLHVHSNLSFDAYIFGNRRTPDAAYQFAKGEAIESQVGERMQLSVPLDFAAVTDHAEGFGLQRQCADPSNGSSLKALCEQLERPSAALFLRLRASGVERPPRPVTEDLVDDAEQAAVYAQETWADVVAAAEMHNEPGRFTTFAAYEYSPPLPDRGKIHRNVIFRSSDVPRRAVSAYDALTEIDLWQQLAESCSGSCAFLTIPHNPNKTWGLAFANQTIDGDIYTAPDWRLRETYEPLVEMFQVKGNSECALGLATTDEECGFEQFLPRCERGQVTNCIHPTSMARDGLKRGLELDAELGFNPLAFGMIGATDTHNSNPGDTEEWDWRGATGLFGATARVRTGPGPGGENRVLPTNPGGLAAIWAPENTRAALFDAMLRKEVYATSGTRIRLRLFGSFEFEPDIDSRVSLLADAYETGVPMGSTLPARDARDPSFLIWAMRDPMSARLDRVQIVKGWTENGETFESVQDVICSDGRLVDPATKRCPETAAEVNLSNCAFDADFGADELKAHWVDSDYSPEQNAFYYARVVEMPTCRWSTYDSLRLGQAPSNKFPATQTEMAWSSPIWIATE